jgi:hypothetical protein
MVPKLLEHLNISYVSLASHSGGSIYLLNTLLTHPHLLHPNQPYVCLFAPWVRPSHSKKAVWQIASQLPAPLIGKYASLAKAVNDNIMPLIALSGSFMKSMNTHSSQTAIIPPPSPNTPSSRNSSIDSHHTPPSLAPEDPEVWEQLGRNILTLMYAEPLDEVSADAQLFLNKPRAVPWCSPSMIWSDVDHFVLLLSRVPEEDDRLSDHNRTLDIDVFHAESDRMVGKRGQHWFDTCWLPGQSSTSSARSNSFGPMQQYSNCTYNYSSEIVEGSDHRDIMAQVFGASERWLQCVRDSVPQEEV